MRGRRMGTELVCDHGKVWKIDDGDGGTTKWMYLTPQNYTFKNGKMVKSMLYTHTHTHTYIFIITKIFKNLCHKMWENVEGGLVNFNNCWQTTYLQVWTYFIKRKSPEMTNFSPERKVKESESHSVMSDSLRPNGLYSPWNSPGQNTGGGNRFLF